MVRPVKVKWLDDFSNVHKHSVDTVGTGSAALEVQNGSIYRTATTLTTPAVLVMPSRTEYDDSGLISGGVESFQRISAAHIVLSGMNHDDSSDLEVRKKPQQL